VRLLLLGGTSFVGRAIAQDALDRGHEVELFSRGRTGTDLFPGVVRHVGDRDAGDYAALSGGSWDAVVDISAYVPRHVREAAAAVGDATERYLFISTGSVYDLAQAAEPLTEQAARLPAEHGTEQVTPETYGRLKVACEDETWSRFGDRAVVVRPGVVAGRTTRRTASPGGCAGRPAADACRSRAVPTSRCRSSTRATSPASSECCSRTAGPARTTPSVPRSP
jgi:2'-hydroxyisoflavone reductase